MHRPIYLRLIVLVDLVAEMVADMFELVSQAVLEVVHMGMRFAVAGIEKMATVIDELG